MARYEEVLRRSVLLCGLYALAVDSQCVVGCVLSLIPATGK